MKEKIKNWILNYGVKAFLFLSLTSVFFCVRPAWHNESPMPESLRNKLD